MTDTNRTGGDDPKTVSECMCVAMSALCRGVFSTETREHFRNARIEVLKGFRSILDQRIQHLSRTEQKGTTVTVE